MERGRGIARLGRRSIDLFLALALVVMTGLVFLNVVLRYGFNSGIVVSVEIARYLFVWLTYIGAIVVMAEEGHQKMDLLLTRMPAKVAAGLRVVGGAMMFLCAALFGYGSWKIALANMDNSSPVSGLPVGLLYWAGVFSGIGIAWAILYRAWTATRKG